MINSGEKNKLPCFMSRLVTVIMAFITSIVFCMEFQEPELLNNIDKGSRFLNIIYTLQFSLKGTAVTSAILFFAFLFLGFYIQNKKDKKYPLFVLINFVISIVWLMGEGFRINDTLSMLHSTTGQMVKSVLYLAGITWFLTQLGILLDIFLSSKYDFRWTSKGKLADFYHRHPFRCSYIALILFWSPQIILSYPGNMCSDAWNQMLQFFGHQKFSSHHPPVHTWLMGMLERAGLAVGSGNLGLYLFVLIQVILFAAVLSYMLYLMWELDSPLWLRIVSFVIPLVSPYYTEYLGLIVKDNIYSYAIMLFVIELIYMLRLKEDYWYNLRHVLLLAVSIIGSILFRNNGIYVIYPTMLVLFAALFIFAIKKKCRKETAVRMIVIFLAPIMFANGVSSFMMSHYDIEKNSIKDALSFPFQQTARYVKEYGDEVTEEEKEVINKVLKYDKLAEKYNPKISDPIKATFRKKSDMKDLIEYFKVWAQQGIKHPIVYIEATMNQNYYLLYPVVENNTLYDKTIFPRKADAFVVYEETGIHEIGLIQKLDVFRTSVNKLIFSLPVIGLLASLAFYNIVLIYLIYYALHKKLFTFLIASLPALISDAIIVLAPVIKGHPRYAFPIIYAMPVLIAYYLYLFYQKKEN